ncbi:MAG TPA: ribulose-phosphate 3-epimerase [Anaerolineales bacterium]|nr:ribulose-phosphate 3-epimerase [Anaerolineales bacterium]
MTTIPILSMTNKYVLSTSILSADFARLGEEIATAESAGADWIHVDVMDGHFVPNITMGPFIVATCRRITKLPLDVHLMIEKPERYLEAFAKAGASGLTVHVETCPDLSGTLKQIKSLGCRAGVVLNPETPVGAIQSVLPEAELVLVLSVHPGYSGQTFIPEAIPKVSEIRKKLDALRSSAWLEVDGGIDVETLPKMKEAGATAFVAATAVFKHPGGTRAGVEALRAVINH